MPPASPASFGEGSARLGIGFVFFDVVVWAGREFGVAVSCIHLFRHAKSCGGISCLIQRNKYNVSSLL